MNWRKAFVVLGLAVLVAATPGAAMAALFNRAAYHGFFANGADQAGGFVFRSGIFPSASPASPTGKPYVQSFLSIVKGNLNGSNSQDQTGAEFIILSMTGYPAGTSKATAHSAAVLADWESRVRTYSNNGWIDWSGNVSYVYNSFWQGSKGGGGDPDDDAWFNDPGSTNDAIVFHKPGSPEFYMLRKPCANPIGNPGIPFGPLEEADYNVALNLTRNGNPSWVVAGKSTSIRVELVNSALGNSEAGTIQVEFENGLKEPCNPFCKPGTQSGLTGNYDTNQGFRPTSGIGVVGVSGRNWFWSVKPLPKSRTTAGTIQFTVLPTTPIGTIITMHARYKKGDMAGAVRHKTITFRVVSERFPGFSGSSGDVHAGGGVCDGILNATGVVKGHASSASFGEYVISAHSAGGITGVDSSTSTPIAGSDTSLNLGATGAYAQICRPDLVSDASAYKIASTNYNIAPAGPFNVTGKSGVWYLAAGTVVTGTVTEKLTIVALNGSIIIGGNILISNTARALGSIPSLGIIAKNDIQIRAGVSRVDAYMFANGTIDTCVERNATCLNALLVNGFLMGRNIAFHRLGVKDTMGAPITETVILNPQIYLNPPRFFDYSADENLLKGQGERAPLF